MSKVDYFITAWVIVILLALKVVGDYVPVIIAITLVILLVICAGVVVTCIYYLLSDINKGVKK